MLIDINFYVTSVNNITYKTNNNKSLSIFTLCRYDVKCNSHKCDPGLNDCQCTCRNIETHKNETNT